MLKRLRTQFVAVIMVIVTIMLVYGLWNALFFHQSNLEQESLAMMRAVPVGMIAPGQPLAPFARPEEEPEQVRLPFFVVQEERMGRCPPSASDIMIWLPASPLTRSFYKS